MASALIIDDDDAVRRTAKIILEANGFDAITAESGMAGVEAVKQRQFDVVIVDLFMTGIDGLQTTKAVREHYPRMPIIAASGFMFGGGNCPEMPEFESMALEAGATLTLYKPFRANDLMQAVHKAIEAAA
ncbi:MAG TPA: response regulator [Pseudolabrys sp.]|nr:response regulator [Pseudolabrys sp.]